MNQDTKVMALAKRWSHHTESGGYDRLARVLGAEVVPRPARSRQWWRRWARHWWQRHMPTSRYLLDYRYEDLLAERELLRQAALRRPEVVHVLYGDEQLDLLLRQRSQLPCPLVATFHLPGRRVTDRFESFHKDLLHGIDTAVVVSRCQLPDFQRWLGPERVVYVQHGIDTQRFRPGESLPARREARLLTVGQHMRDFEALRWIIDRCQAQGFPAQFDLVLPSNRWPSFAGCRNVRLQTGIAEPELIRRYQEADALLLPVIDATANNSVLESLAAGTPVISNAVGGMTDYVNSHCGWLFDPGDVNGIVELIAAMCRHREIASARREAARRQALELDWSCIARQVRSVYQAVVDGAPRANGQ